MPVQISEPGKKPPFKRVALYAAKKEVRREKMVGRGKRSGDLLGLGVKTALLLLRVLPPPATQPLMLGGQDGARSEVMDHKRLCLLFENVRPWMLGTTNPNPPTEKKGGDPPPSLQTLWNPDFGPPFSGDWRG